MDQVDNRLKTFDQYNQAKLFIILISIFCSICSCNYNLASYIKPKSTDVVAYQYCFVKSDDPIYRNFEVMFGNPVKGDTVIGEISIVYKTIEIGSDKIYYAISVEDSSKIDPPVGQNHFLNAAMIFSGDSVLLASINKKSDLTKLKKIDFDQCLPSKVKYSDTLQVFDKTIPNNEKRLLFYGFKKEKLTASGKKLKNCLAITIMLKWPESSSTGKIWLHKNYGVVKWLRTTGRLDQRKF